jgi:hypothetical protein
MKMLGHRKGIVAEIEFLGGELIADAFTKLLNLLIELLKLFNAIKQVKVTFVKIFLNARQILFNLLLISISLYIK